MITIFQVDMFRLDTLHLYDTSTRSYIYIYICPWLPMSSPWRWVWRFPDHETPLVGSRNGLGQVALSSSNWSQIIRNGSRAKLGADSFIGIGFTLWLCQQFANLNMAIGIVDFHGCSPEIWWVSIVVLGYQRVSLLSCDFMVVPYGPPAWRVESV